jgi:hypothetical protein
VWRSGFSLSIFVCTSQAVGIGGLAKTQRPATSAAPSPSSFVLSRPLRHGFTQARLCLARRPPPLHGGGSRAFSALLPSMTFTRASLYDGRATHRALELPSATATTSFGMLRRWLQGIEPRSRPDGDVLLQLDGGMGESSTKATSVQSDDCGLGFGPNRPRSGLNFFKN